jgi:L-iditol 2-dehydrogenase
VRIARTLSPDETRVEIVPDPICGPGEVVCRILACATCGSDVQDFYVARKLPAVLGHEPAGQVVAVGRGVTAVEPGDRVAIHHHAPCGACDRCARGHETLCAAYRATALDPGGFAEYVRVPADLVGELLPLDGLDALTATCTEPLGCALRAQVRAGVRPGQSLLVVGAGASGLLHAAAALAGGVERVAVAEPDAARRALAVAWGAEEHDGAPVDVAIVCTSKPAAIRAAADALDVGGTLCLYAPTAPDEPLPIAGWDVFSRELTVISSWSAGPDDMRAALALLRAGAIRTGELIDGRYDLAGTGAALAAQRSGAVLKAVVVP